jgi:cell division topological specificity factor
VFAALREKLFGHKATKNLAKSRLHFVLVQDRTGLNHQELSSFKEEMLRVIEKYFVIDKSGFDVSYKRAGESTTLYINSPIIVRRQDSLGHDVGARKAKRRGMVERQEKEEPAPPAVEVAPEAAPAEPQPETTELAEAANLPR